MTKNSKIHKRGKNSKLKLQKNFLGRHQGITSPQEKAPAHQRESPALHNMKFLHFFPFLWPFCPP
jgi:hypothetical protein